MDILNLVLINLEKIGIGIGIFLCSYLANIGLGAWHNVKIEGQTFDWKLIGQSMAKFAILGVSIALLSGTISVLPSYLTYVGIEITPETLEIIDGVVIISMFTGSTIKYVKDSIDKLSNILGK